MLCLVDEACGWEHQWAEGLRVFGFPSKVRIGNDHPTFTTPYHAGFVFRDRDRVGD
jgi:hypothetical protein